ncbi:DUF4386 domain-containing protein [bacterium]|nr:DUF4386 domain-containing protein [bacterium]NUN44825.1 DUF4386 domain-containing protein [bacterium]
MSTARLAGFLYLAVVLTGMFSLAYVPSVLIDWNNASVTYNNIKSAETLFRLGIVAGIICYTAFVLLPFVLYKLLSQVNQTFAVGMVVLSTVSAPFSLVNLLYKVNVLTLIANSANLSGSDLEKTQDQIMLLLSYYGNGIQIVSIFWGLWLFPFGYLVFKSGFLPKILGVFLMAGCFGYLINFTGRFLYPNYPSLGIGGYVSLPATIGEIGICLWLLIGGIKTQTASE